MDPNDPRCPIRIRAVPTTIETEICQDDLLDPLHEAAIPRPQPFAGGRRPASRIGNRSLWGDKIQSLGDSITEGYYRYALFKNLVKANYDFDYVGSGYEACMV